MPQAPVSRRPDRILHVQLTLMADPEIASFRYFAENPNEFQPRMLRLAEIGELVKLAERDYYPALPEDYVKTGRSLYRWLDGADRLFSQKLKTLQKPGQPLVVAISAAGLLAHLPWEILHDDQGFLVGQNIVPVRWVGAGASLEPSNRPAPKRPLQLLFMATSPQGVEPQLDFEAKEVAMLEATRKPSILLEVEESGCLEELVWISQALRTVRAAASVSGGLAIKRGLVTVG